MGKYDRLIKENLRHLVRPLAKQIEMNLEDTRIEVLKDKLQYKVEREPDFLFKVCHNDPSKDYIGHFDFQVPNDLTMPERMLFYRTLIKFIYKLPVRQVVFYLSDDPLEMANFIEEDRLYFEYDIYEVREFPATPFLESDIPQEVMVAILCDYEGETPENMMEKILLRLQKLSKRKKDFQKYAFHLHILSGLRKLHKIYQQKIKTMPLIYDIHLEIDPFYIEGMEKGIEKGIEQGIEQGEIKKATVMVENLLFDSKFPISSIANLAVVTEAFVLSVQNRLIQEGKLLCINKNGKISRKRV